MTEKNSSELFSAIHENESYILRKDERCLLYNYGDNIRFESVFEGNPHFKKNTIARYTAMTNWEL